MSCLARCLAERRVSTSVRHTWHPGNKAYLLAHSRKKYLALTDYYQMLGSEGHRTCLQDINGDNGMALFAFASTVVLLMLALPTRWTNRRLGNPMHHLMELASVHRGIKTSLTPLVGSILRTEFAPLLYVIWPLHVDPSGRPDWYASSKEKQTKINPPPADTFLYSLLDLEHCFLPQDTWEALQQLRGQLKREVPEASHPDYL